MTSSDETARTAIAEQAGAWYIANQAGELGYDDAVAFFAWLKTSPVHIEEYLGVAQIAGCAGAALGEPRISLEDYLRDTGATDPAVVALGAPPAPQGRREVWPSFAQVRRIAASIAALAVLAASAIWWNGDGELLGLPRTYRTAHGEQSIHQLPDGSTVRLDTDSVVNVRYSNRERVVELDRGQALFEVSRDQRRFRVAAGDVGAIAVGTRFDVYRRAETTLISVAEGQVAVYAGAAPRLPTEGPAPKGMQIVTAGYQARADAGVLAAQPVPVDLDQTLGWLQHKIVFKFRPLGEVAAEFNRYGRTPVEIDDKALRALPVSGRFDADDTESFVEFLATVPGVKVESASTRIRISRLVSQHNDRSR
jgi:transmembrane sensor